jgi:hypothetical protein
MSLEQAFAAALQLTPQKVRLGSHFLDETTRKANLELRFLVGSIQRRCSRFEHGSMHLARKCEEILPRCNRNIPGKSSAYAASALDPVKLFRHVPRRFLL